MIPITDALAVVAPAIDISGPPQGEWTYREYAMLPDDERFEIVDGVLYMAPAPNTGHQSVSNLIATHLTIHIQFTGKGHIFTAPCDVELSPTMVVQPDVIVVLQDNAGIISPSRIVGAPDLIIEIASPATAGYDRREKQDAYARAGVKEYWIADPAARTVEVLILDGAAYRSKGAFLNKAVLPSQVVADFPVRVEQFFV